MRPRGVTGFRDTTAFRLYHTGLGATSYVTAPALRLAFKALRNPRRALLRMVLRARLRRASLQDDRALMLDAISAAWDVDALALAEEYRRSRIARRYYRQVLRLNPRLGTARMGTSESFGCEFLYLLVRAARPQVVVETGVLYGASSGHILAALEANGAGELHSIDLGTRPGEPAHDTFVLPNLKCRWDYIEGDVKRELSALLSRLGGLDMFYHDSLHTFEHMMWEYDTASSWLRPGGVLASHDVQVADSLRGIVRQNAFPVFCRRHGLAYATIRNSGFALWTGVELFPPAPSPRSLDLYAGLGGIGASAAPLA